jgi:hypothetical protein
VWVISIALNILRTDLYQNAAEYQKLCEAKKDFIPQATIFTTIFTTIYNTIGSLPETAKNVKL